MTARAVSKEQTRERILEAAFGRFLTEHFDQTTLKNIAEDAGVSLQTVLIHFGSKEGVVEAMGDWPPLQEMAPRDVEPGAVEDAARAVVESYELTGLATLHLLQLEGRFSAITRLIEDTRGRHRAWVERIFADAIAGARKGSARTRRVAELVSVFDVHSWHVLRQSLEPDETAKAMAELADGVMRR